ncbi:MAG: glycosyltransferase, partial [Candidatus Methylomirabilis sp.]|nr:glycosyltransferase [Deltaproteobacteria bacterium]
MVTMRSPRADYPELRVARFKKNAGQTAAMIAGLRLARGERIVTMDADGQNDPADIPLLLGMLKEHPAAFGVRVKRRDTPARRFASWFANGVRNRLLRTDLRDTGCSLKAFRREAVPELPPFKGMHRFVPSFTMMKGYKGVEVPVNHRPRERGVSKYPAFGRAIPALLDCLMVRRMQRNLSRYEIEEDR